jgi:hypothetical protein
MGGTQMSIKKTVAIATAAGALAAISVPAMALENEFHGMYKFMAYESNFFEGTTLNPQQAGALLRKDSKSGFLAEQRARLQYTAKANADLKLVTHFELDTRFGGKDTTKGYLGTASGNDAGNIDADQLTLETKSLYVDFNCPLTGANVKVGLQPWADAYQSLFLLADMTGVSASKKFGPATASLGWFRYDDNTQTDTTNIATFTGAARKSANLFVADGKFALNKDMSVGASYYYIQNDMGAGQVTSGVANTALFNYESLNMFGLNADLTFGPANVKPFAAFQFGDINSNNNMKGMLLGAVTKTKIASGAVNLSAVYMSGDDKAGQEKSFRTVGPNYTYFNAANMWLLIRNGQAINSSTSVLGNDMTVNGAGMLGVFGGYEATMGKLFYNANIGYAQSEKGTKKGIGTELNAQVGYKLFDNLSASGAVAYCILGDKADASKADDPYALNLQLSYTF